MIQGAIAVAVEAESRRKTKKKAQWEALRKRLKEAKQKALTRRAKTLGSVSAGELGKH